MPTRRIIGAIIVFAVAALSLDDRPAAQKPALCTQQTLGPAAIDIPSVAIQPVFRLNGRPFPGAHAGIALFTLWASDHGDLFNGPQLVLGETPVPPQSVRVVPGVYDVYYSWVAGLDIPRNEQTRVLERVSLVADGPLIIDVPMIQIGGVKQHNGNPFGFDGFASLSLHGLDNAGIVPLGGAQPPPFRVTLIPGRYEFRYDWQQGVSLPNNRHAAVRRLDLSVATDNVVLNVRSVIQPFQFLLNGAQFPSSPFDRGDLVLRRGEQEEVVLGSSHESNAAVRVIRGSYDVHWRHVVGANVPANSDAVIQRGLRIDGDLRVIDVPSVELSGTFLVNGEPTPASEFENAHIRLVRKRSTDTLLLGQTRFGGYVKHVVPGVYEIVYEHVTGAAVLPSNPRATIARDWEVTASHSRTIDIPAGTYKGAFALNGSGFPGSAFERGLIFAVPSGNGHETVSLGFTNSGGFDHRLLPGRYRAAYAHVVGSEVPRNTFTTFGRTREVIAGTELDANLNVIAGPLQVSYLHNGAALPPQGPQNVRVHLIGGINSLVLPDSLNGVPEISVMPGKFDLFYEFRGGPDLPLNAFMRIGCWQLAP